MGELGEEKSGLEKRKKLRTYLVLLLLTRHYENLTGGVNDVELADDGGSVGSDEELLEVIDDHLVATIGT